MSVIYGLATKLSKSPNSFVQEIIQIWSLSLLG
jgi:hypothetical protein